MSKPTQLQGRLWVLRGHDVGAFPLCEEHASAK